MSLWRLAWRYAVYDPASLGLRVILIALAGALVSLALLVSAQFERLLLRDAQGIDLVVGAKGSPLQLVLAGVYQLDTPTGNVKLSEVEALRRERLIAQVIPLSLGDSYKGYRIVGAPLEFVTRLQESAKNGDGKLLASGRLYAKPMEVTLGAQTARNTGLQVGQSFTGSHGLSEGGPEHADQVYTVVGILAPGAGVLDRLALTPLESVWRVHEGEVSDAKERAQLEAEREVSLALIRYASPIAAATLPRRINASEHLQAASPAVESARLQILFGRAVSGLGWLVLMISVIAVFAVVANVAQAVRERRGQLAALRMAGASRWHLTSLILLEVVVVLALGLMLGLVGGHALLALASHWLSPRGEFALNALEFQWEELWFGLAVLLSCLVVSMLPLARLMKLDLSELMEKR